MLQKSATTKFKTGHQGSNQASTNLPRKAAFHASEQLVRVGSRRRPPL
jgi:hypothetical protein